MRSSIIIANFNKSQFLGPLLASIESQLKEEDEVIIIDDASTDNSIDVIKKFPFLLIPNSQNLGPAACRNIGIKKAKGEILIFCDSDTLWEPYTLERIKKWFVTPSVTGVTGNLSNEPLSKSWSGFFYLLEEEENLIRNHTQTGPCGYWSSTLGALRSEAVKEFGGFDEDYRGADIEDLVLGAKIAKKHELIFDKELIFHHDYPDLFTMLKKALRRVAQITEIEEAFRNNPLIDNNFRKIGYILSLCILFTLILPKLFPILVFIKMLYHHYFFNKAFKRHGLFFCLYSVIVMYALAICVALGVILGRTRKLKVL